MSDLVFLRTYYEMQAKMFYNPVTTYFENRLLKTTAEVRRERGLTIPEGSAYERNIVKTEKVLRKFSVPKKLEAQLPFKSKQKLLKPKEHEEIKTL
jgi:ribosome biogenesis protein BMS1